MYLTNPEYEIKGVIESLLDRSFPIVVHQGNPNLHV